MAYIGVQPTDTYLSIASQQITGTGSATYTLDYSVSNEEDVAVFVNNVRQNVSSYTVSSNQLTLGGTISASDSCWVLFLGRTVGTKTPAVGSVTNDMLAGSIATSKLADGSTFATTNGITMADHWCISSNFSGAVSPITSNWTRPTHSLMNYLGSGMTESSGVFSFPSTGYYMVFPMMSCYQPSSGGQSRINYFITTITTNNGGSWTDIGYESQASETYDSNNTHMSLMTAKLLDITDISNQKIRFGTYFANNNVVCMGNTTYPMTGFTIIRLGDT